MKIYSNDIFSFYFVDNKRWRNHDGEKNTKCDEMYDCKTLGSRCYHSKSEVREGSPLRLIELHK